MIRWNHNYHIHTLNPFFLPHEPSVILYSILSLLNVQLHIYVWKWKRLNEAWINLKLLGKSEKSPSKRNQFYFENKLGIIWTQGRKYVFLGNGEGMIFSALVFLVNLLSNKYIDRKAQSKIMLLRGYIYPTTSCFHEMDEYCILPGRNERGISNSTFIVFNYVYELGLTFLCYH